MAWYVTNSGGKTHPDGEKEVNPWGLHDMLGNVWEWCQDSPGNDQALPDIDPVCLDEGSDRVIRGGAWSHDARYCRAASRHAYWPGYRYGDLGFRLAGGRVSASGTAKVVPPARRR